MINDPCDEIEFKYNSGYGLLTAWPIWYKGKTVCYTYQNMKMVAIWDTQQSDLRGGLLNMRVEE